MYGWCRGDVEVRVGVCKGDIGTVHRLLRHWPKWYWGGVGVCRGSVVVI